MLIPTHEVLAERGRKVCNCHQCVVPEKHPCSRALWAATIAKKVLEEMLLPEVATETAEWLGAARKLADGTD